jgi:hypothetical protein
MKQVKVGDLFKGTKFDKSTGAVCEVVEKEPEDEINPFRVKKSKFKH